MSVSPPARNTRSWQIAFGAVAVVLLLIGAGLVVLLRDPKPPLATTSPLLEGTPLLVDETGSWEPWFETGAEPTVALADLEDGDCGTPLPQRPGTPLVPGALVGAPSAAGTLVRWLGPPLEPGETVLLQADGADGTRTHRLRAPATPLELGRALDSAPIGDPGLRARLTTLLEPAGVHSLVELYDLLMGPDSPAFLLTLHEPGLAVALGQAWWDPAADGPTTYTRPGQDRDTSWTVDAGKPLDLQPAPLTCVPTGPGGVPIRVRDGDAWGDVQENRKHHGRVYLEIGQAEGPLTRSHVFRRPADDNGSWERVTPEPILPGIFGPPTDGPSRATFIDDPGPGRYQYTTVPVDLLGRFEAPDDDPVPIVETVAHDLMPPGIPTGLRVEEVGGLLRLEWRPPARDPVVYAIEQASTPMAQQACNGGDLCWQPIGRANATAFEVEAPDQTAWFRVRALDAAGNRGAPTAAQPYFVQEEEREAPADASFEFPTSSCRDCDLPVIDDPTNAVLFAHLGSGHANGTVTSLCRTGGDQPYTHWATAHLDASGDGTMDLSPYLPASSRPVTVDCQYVIDDGSSLLFQSIQQFFNVEPPEASLQAPPIIQDARWDDSAAEVDWFIPAWGAYSSVEVTVIDLVTGTSHQERGAFRPQDGLQAAAFAFAAGEPLAGDNRGTLRFPDLDPHHAHLVEIEGILSDERIGGTPVPLHPPGDRDIGTLDVDTTSGTGGVTVYWECYDRCFSERYVVFRSSDGEDFLQLTSVLVKQEEGATIFVDQTAALYREYQYIVVALDATTLEPVAQGGPVTGHRQAAMETRIADAPSQQCQYDPQTQTCYFAPSEASYEQVPHEVIPSLVGDTSPPPAQPCIDRPPLPEQPFLFAGGFEVQPANPVAPGKTGRGTVEVTLAGGVEEVEVDYDVNTFVDDATANRVCEGYASAAWPDPVQIAADLPTSTDRLVLHGLNEKRSATATLTVQMPDSIHASARSEAGTDDPVHDERLRLHNAEVWQDGAVAWHAAQPLSADGDEIDGPVRFPLETVSAAWVPLIGLHFDGTTLTADHAALIGEDRTPWRSTLDLMDLATIPDPEAPVPLKVASLVADRFGHPFQERQFRNDGMFVYTTWEQRPGTVSTLDASGLAMEAASDAPFSFTPLQPVMALVEVPAGATVHLAASHAADMDLGDVDFHFTRTQNRHFETDSVTGTAQVAEGRLTVDGITSSRPLNWLPHGEQVGFALVQPSSLVFHAGPLTNGPDPAMAWWDPVGEPFRRNGRDVQAEPGLNLFPTDATLDWTCVGRTRIDGDLNARFAAMEGTLQGGSLATEVRGFHVDLDPFSLAFRDGMLQEAIMTGRLTTGDVALDLAYITTEPSTGCIVGARLDPDERGLELGAWDVDAEIRDLRFGDKEGPPTLHIRADGDLPYLERNDGEPLSFEIVVDARGTARTLEVDPTAASTLDGIPFRLDEVRLHLEGERPPFDARATWRQPEDNGRAWLEYAGVPSLPYFGAPRPILDTTPHTIVQAGNPVLGWDGPIVLERVFAQTGDLKLAWTYDQTLYLQGDGEATGRVVGFETYSFLPDDYLPTPDLVAGVFSRLPPGLELVTSRPFQDAASAQGAIDTTLQRLEERVATAFDDADGSLDALVREAQAPLDHVRSAYSDTLEEQVRGAVSQWNTTVRSQIRSDFADAHDAIDRGEDGAVALTEALAMRWRDLDANLDGVISGVNGTVDPHLDTLENYMVKVEQYLRAADQALGGSTHMEPEGPPASVVGSLSRAESALVQAQRIAGDARSTLDDAFDALDAAARTTSLLTGLDVEAVRSDLEEAKWHIGELADELDSVGNSVTPVLADVRAQITKVQDNLTYVRNLTAAVREAVEDIRGSLDRLTDPLLQELAGLHLDIRERVTGTDAEAHAALRELEPMVLDWASGLADDAATWAGDWISAAGRAVGNLTDAMSAEALEPVEAAFGEIHGAVGDMTRNVRAMNTGAVASLQGAVQDAVDRAGGAIQDVVSAVEDTSSAVSDFADQAKVLHMDAAVILDGRGMDLQIGVAAGAAALEALGANAATSSVTGDRLGLRHHQEAREVLEDAQATGCGGTMTQRIDCHVLAGGTLPDTTGFGGGTGGILREAGVHIYDVRGSVTFTGVGVDQRFESFALSAGVELRPAEASDPIFAADTVSFSIHRSGAVEFLVDGATAAVLADGVDVDLHLALDFQKPLFEGSIAVNGLDFELLTISHAGATVGFGNMDGELVAYMGFDFDASFQTEGLTGDVSVGGTFLAGSINRHSRVLQRIVPDAMAKIGEVEGMRGDVLTGAYVRAAAAAPLYENSCWLRVSAGLTLKFWVWAPPTGAWVVGGGLGVLATATVGCVASAVANIYLEYNQVGDHRRASGVGFIVVSTGLFCNPSEWTDWRERWWGKSPTCIAAGAQLQIDLISDRRPPWDYDYAVDVSV